MKCKHWNVPCYLEGFCMQGAVRFGMSDIQDQSYLPAGLSIVDTARVNHKVGLCR